jgi:hypothetical protein
MRIREKDLGGGGSAGGEASEWSECGCYFLVLSFDEEGESK